MQSKMRSYVGSAHMPRCGKILSTRRLGPFQSEFRAHKAHHMYSNPMQNIPHDIQHAAPNNPASAFPNLGNAATRAAGSILLKPFSSSLSLSLSLSYPAARPPLNRTYDYLDHVRHKCRFGPRSLRRGKPARSARTS